MMPGGYVLQNEDGLNQALIGNAAVYTTRMGQSEEKEVDGKTMTFARVYNTRMLVKDAASMVDSGATLMPGYVVSADFMTSNSMWAWQPAIQLGWLPSDEQPKAIPDYNKAAENSQKTSQK